MTDIAHLIFSFPHPFPPPPPPPSPPPPPRGFSPAAPSAQRNPVFSRRRGASLFFLSLAAACTPLSSPLRCPPAVAFGIPGPKEWLKDQKRKASRFVLAPIEASRKSLRAAYLSLTSDAGARTDDAGEIREILNSAARDCVPEYRNSVVDFQAKTGVEVCTFRLVVKNASSLLDNNDPVKLEAEANLDELIRSFGSLGDALDTINLQVASDRQKIEGKLKNTISALDNFEQSIKNCLGV